MVLDPSMGKTKEFFGMKVTNDKGMMEAMSPNSVDVQATKKLLAGATLDAVQLPGRCHTTETVDEPLSVAEAIAELAEDKRSEWNSNGPRRDVQWRTQNRTFLRTITSHRILQE
jgi:hypothetical protein